ncbi:MAG: response regulator [Flammeovirgaceae bacterium]
MKTIENIFLVDDDKIYLHVTNHTLKKTLPKVKVHSFLMAQDALDQIEVVQPDIIFLDLNMPLMDGWEFLEALAKKDIATKINIFICSSSIDITDKERASAHPLIKSYIEKPLDASKIQKAIQEIT